MFHVQHKSSKSAKKRLVAGGLIEGDFYICCSCLQHSHTGVVCTHEAKVLTEGGHYIRRMLCLELWPLMPANLINPFWQATTTLTFGPKRKGKRTAEQGSSSKRQRHYRDKESLDSKIAKILRTSFLQHVSYDEVESLGKVLSTTSLRPDQVVQRIAQALSEPLKHSTQQQPEMRAVQISRGNPSKNVKRTFGK